MNPSQQPQTVTVTTLRRLSLIGVIALLSQTTPARSEPQAAPIPPEAAVKPDAVHGLQVAYYDFQRVHPVGTPGIDSMDIAKRFVAAHQPDVTSQLNARSIDFPVGNTRVVTASGTTLGDYLLADAAARENPPAELKRAMSSRNIFVFTGFIKVDKAGVYTFRVAADDGSELTIGGVVVHTVVGGGLMSPTWEPYLARAEFSEPGIYPVKLLHYDMARDIGIEAYADVEPRGEAREIAAGQDLHLLPFLTAAPAK